MTKYICVLRVNYYDEQHPKGVPMAFSGSSFLVFLARHRAKKNLTKFSLTSDRAYFRLSRPVETIYCLRNGSLTVV